MRRSERHHALLDVLRANAERPIPVPRLAERFAVSTRTIERDIRTLLEAGVPLYTHPGRHGGYAIRRDYSLPPLAFTDAEATSVVAALGAMMASPFAPDSRRAMDKVLAAMPPAHRATARSLAGRVAALAPEPAPAPTTSPGDMHGGCITSDARMMPPCVRQWICLLQCTSAPANSHAPGNNRCRR